MYSSAKRVGNLYKVMLNADNGQGSIVGHCVERYPSKMSRRKCRGKNVADKMSRITMSLIYNVADKNVADKNVAVKNVADKNVVDIFPATFSPYWEPYDSSL